MRINAGNETVQYHLEALNRILGLSPNVNVGPRGRKVASADDNPAAPAATSPTAPAVPKRRGRPRKQPLPMLATS